MATYNVHRCIGADGRHDPGRVAAVIREIAPDVIALQEVDSRAGVEGGVDQFEFLARATEMTPIAGPTLRDHRGHYGNAVLTRLRPLETRQIDLSLPRREPRAALDVLLDDGGRRIRLVATHLGLRWNERRRQVARLVEEFAPGSEGGLLVLLGDMNEWLPAGLPLSRLRAIFGSGPRPRTFPARRPLFALDRIWCRPAAALDDVRVHATPLARAASDHLPLRAKLG